MPDNSRLPIKSTLLAALMLSATLQAASTDTASGRWHCQASTEGGWQCGSSEPADGLGSKFIAPKKSAATLPADAKAEYRIDGEQLDWVPIQALTEAQKQNTAGYCAGRYVEPDYVDQEQRALDPSSQPIQGSAEVSQTDENGITTLTGNVVLSQGNRQIKSEQATLDRDAGTASFTGRTQFRQPGLLLIGEAPEVDLNSDEITIHDAKYVGHKSHMRGTAKKIYRDTTGVLRIDQGSVTHCQPGSNTWALVGSEIKLDQEGGVGTIKHARLHVKDTPVLYFPYMSFPLDNRRKSGFLTPSYGSSDGTDISTPYYWNIAPNYDATLTPRYIGDRGFMGEAEFRYLHENNTGELGAAFLSGDDAYQNKDRWLGALDHTGTVFDNINTRVDFTRVSDDDYFSDLGTDLSVTSTTQLLQLAEASYRSTYWNVTARAQGYQELDSDNSYERLPQLLANINYPHDASGLEFGLMTEYTNFDRDNSDLAGIARAVGHRSRIEPSVSWLFETPYAFIKPKASYRYSHYQLDDLATGLNDSPSLSVPVLSIDSGLFFERDMTWAGISTQTFEPRLFYLRVPEEKGQQEIPLFDTSMLDFSYNQLFREDRFVGGDRVGDANQLSLGLTTRFLEPNGFERARASIGQIYYQDDREVTLSGAPISQDKTSDSPIAAELMYAFNSSWRMQGDIEWDNDNNNTTQSSLYFRYHGDKQHLVNIGYRVRNDGSERIEQTDLSTIWPISDRWSFISRWNHDLIRDRIIEAFAGVEYQSCCWAVRVVGRQWINDDDITANDGVDEKNAIYIQFLLKGLGNIGDSMESLFSDSIRGYQED